MKSIFSFLFVLFFSLLSANDIYTPVNEFYAGRGNINILSSYRYIKYIDQGKTYTVGRLVRVGKLFDPSSYELYDMQDKHLLTLEYQSTERYKTLFFKMTYLVKTPEGEVLGTLLTDGTSKVVVSYVYEAPDGSPLFSTENASGIVEDFYQGAKLAVSEFEFLKQMKKTTVHYPEVFENNTSLWLQFLLLKGALGNIKQFY